jgi:KDO2-lipid IV(A) lauroyltransferase
VDLALRGLIGGARALPYRARVPAFGRVMRHLVAPAAGYRARALEQLALVWPDMAPAERAALADAVADNAGRTLIENYSRAGLSRVLADAPVTGAGLAAIARARAEGRPAILVTGHFANHEAARAALNLRGYPVGVLYRPVANPQFNRHYVRTLADVGAPVFEQGRRGTAGFVRHLRAGGMVGLLFDLYHGRGALIPFLGRPAPTSTSAADLALRHGALLVPYFAIRQPDGLSFAIELDAPIPHTEPLAMTRAMTEALERRVARAPAQWFWIHRRWKPKRVARRLQRS